MPGVEGCLIDRLLSAGGVLAACTRRAETGLVMGGGEGITWWACTTALCESESGGRVELMSSDGDGALVTASLDDLGFLGFLVEDRGEDEGDSWGASCGDSNKLMSIFKLIYELASSGRGNGNELRILGLGFKRRKGQPFGRLKLVPCLAGWQA